jgi:hypothetical protein
MMGYLWSFVEGLEPPYGFPADLFPSLDSLRELLKFKQEKFLANFD